MALRAPGPVSMEHAVDIPPHAVLPCLRDAGALLDGGAEGALAAQFPGAGGRGGGVDVGALVRALCGPLPPARRDTVDAAWRRVADMTAAGKGVSPPGTFPPTLGDFRDLYAAGAHPDVRAGKRREEEALTEFLETFGGPTFTGAGSGEPGGAQAGAPVSEPGFRAYYAAVSLHSESDAHFTATLFDTWGLQWSAGQAHAAEARAAGGGGGEGRNSVSQLMGGVAPGYRMGPRGPGNEGLPREAYTGAGVPPGRRGWGVEKLVLG